MPLTLSSGRALPSFPKKRAGARPPAAVCYTMDMTNKQSVPTVGAELLERRGIRLRDMAEVVYKLQRPYNNGIDVETCLDSVEVVVRKREVQYAIIVGHTLDTMAEEGTLKEPLGSIVRENSPLFGIDKVFALGIVNLYGSIGFSNYGLLALEEPEFFKRWKEKNPNAVYTFLDDIVAAIVAAACSRIAHRGEVGGRDGAARDVRLSG